MTYLIILQIPPSLLWIIIAILACAVVALALLPRRLYTKLADVQSRIKEKDKALIELENKCNQLSDGYRKQNDKIKLLYLTRKAVEAALKEESVTELLDAVSSQKIWDINSDSAEMERHVISMREALGVTEKAKAKIKNIEAAINDLKDYAKASKRDHNQIKAIHLGLIKLAFLSIDEVNDYYMSVDAGVGYYAQLLKLRSGEITKDEFIGTLRDSASNDSDYWAQRFNRSLQNSRLPACTLYADGYKFEIKDRDNSTDTDN